ncbi:MAG: helix-turn-helix transcriptional regulator [Pseudomonadota bacterium]|jgi:DNA-binding transcriptional ArsR family regulator|nr:transcriptional regulator [Pseudomonadota bacterium]QKK04972.1 MAG: helix-turn-helix transcriptional regulator [Pseudomonadota bacterium]|tara:strand:+ start:336 stop:647 length:312 start_codon:yes stop_codon:yes gene_type:complete
MAKHQDMEKALHMLKTLGHPVRLSILCNLIENGEMNAGDIVEQESTLSSQSQTSQYLRKLRDEGLIEARKEGQHVYYRLKSDDVRTLIGVLHQLYCGENSCAP